MAEMPRRWRPPPPRVYPPYQPKPRPAQRPKSEKQQFADELFETIMANIATGDVTLVELAGLPITPTQLIQAVQHRARTHKPPVLLFARRAMLDSKEVELFMGEGAKLHPPYPNT